LRAARANHVFRADEKRIRTKNMVIDKYQQGTRLWFSTRSSIARGCAFYPCAIDDPRGRAAVRASAATKLEASLEIRPLRQPSYGSLTCRV
jgi:hypothetical protein